MRQLLFRILLFFSLSNYSQTDTVIKHIVITNSFTNKNSKSVNTNQDLERKNDNKNITPFNKLNNYNNWAIKAKVLPWMGLVASGMNYSLGLELGFLKNNSIGIDAYKNDYSFDAPDEYDSTQNVYNGGARKAIRDQALFLNYRHYLNFNKIRENAGLTFYAGAFIRYGYIYFEYDNGYKKKDNIINERHYSAGSLIGILLEITHFKKSENLLNLDANIGLYAKKKELIKEIFDYNNKPIYESDFPTSVGFRIGVTLSLTMKYSSTH